ncbi:MAG: MotA/TolQ/ExbB proton channel family protein [Candidatus Delongbacteria bacterium]|nr:MotA/TolQ/ExbB proton channel family protein [Candidatus Delongbacteria bacterium]
MIKYLYTLLFMLIALSGVLAQEQGCQPVLFHILSQSTEIRYDSISQKPSGFHIEWGYWIYNLNNNRLNTPDNCLFPSQSLEWTVMKFLDTASTITYTVRVEAGEVNSSKDDLTQVVKSHDYSLSGDSLDFEMLRADFGDFSTYQGYRITVDPINLTDISLRWPSEGRTQKSYSVGFGPKVSIETSSNPEENTIPVYTIFDTKAVNTVRFIRDDNEIPSALNVYINGTVKDNLNEWFGKGGWIAGIITLIGVIGLVLSIIFLAMICRYPSRIIGDQSLKQSWIVFFKQPTLENYRLILLNPAIDFSKGSFYQRLFLFCLGRHWQYKYHWSKSFYLENEVSGRATAELSMMNSLRTKYLASFTRYFNLEYFWNMSALTPSLGLLGTVTGIAGAFNNIAQNSSIESQVLIQSLSGGINEALYTTIFGLFFGIPLMLIYFGLKYLLDKKIESVSNSLYDVFYPEP